MKLSKTLKKKTIIEDLKETFRELSEMEADPDTLFEQKVSIDNAIKYLNGGKRWQ